MSEQGTMQVKRVFLVILGLIAAGLCIPLFLSFSAGNEREQSLPDNVTPAQSLDNPVDAHDSDVIIPASITTSRKLAAIPVFLQTRPLLVVLVLVVCSAVCIAISMYQGSVNQQRLLEEAQAAEEARLQNEAMLAEKAKADARLRDSALKGSIMIAVCTFVFLLSVAGVISKIRPTMVHSVTPYSWLSIKYWGLIAIVAALLAAIPSYYCPNMAMAGYFGGIGVLLVFSAFNHYAGAARLGLCVLSAIFMMLHVVPIGLPYLFPSVSIGQLLEPLEPILRLLPFY